ncbi:MAG: DNA primase large subunit PriL [Nitrososphaerales archaeon]
MEIEFGLEDLAKYPFLKEAGDYIKCLSLSIDDLKQEDYQRVLERAKHRVIEAIQKNFISTEIEEPNLEILSFPLALIIVKAIGIDYFMHRYSLAESLRAEKLLEKEKKIIISNIFRSAFNVDLISIEHEFFDFKISLIDYLLRATHFHKPEWKLINRVVEKGFVYVKTHELIRLMREEIRRIIYERMKNLSLPKIPENVKEIIDEIIKELPSIPSKELQEFTPRMFPPCVMHVLDLLQKGQNVPHYGRFLLTSYLLGIGKSIDEVINIYPKAPDFSERLTRYQVEHIAGMRGGRKRYKTPSCRTLITHGLCFKDEILCDKIKNPIQFGRKPVTLKKKNNNDKSDEYG